MQERASSNDGVVRQRIRKPETTIPMERKRQWSRTLSKNAYYKELKPISVADKECIDEHESDSEILQYDSDEASVERDKSHNE